nr:MAG TPA: hypothetical protein [Caudoviricetes sp.]
MRMRKYIKNNYLKNLGYTLAVIFIIGVWLSVLGICVYFNTVLSYTIFGIWVILTFVLLITILDYYDKEGKYKD